MLKTSLDWIVYLAPVGDPEDHPWVFSRSGKLGDSELFPGGVGDSPLPLLFLKLQESW